MSDQDKGKGFSLRKRNDRRHEIRHLGNGRPDRHHPPSKPSSRERSGDRASETDVARPRANDQTSNLVKKRYSVRYNQAPDFDQGGVLPVPGVPKIPSAFAQQDGARDAAPHHQGVDMQLLRDPSLNSDEYVSSILAHASEQDLANYQRDLQKIKNRASTDLQYNVYQNRTQFIKISKEAEKLKTEIQTLQGLMNDLSSTLEQTGWTGPSGRLGGADDAARKRANRSSVANLEAMWNTQLQTMWKMIEGSQKFIAAIPGRHVVLEMEGWVELDAATWKTKKPAHLVLLNDHLLVATRKRKRTDPSRSAQGQKAPTKLVAEHCWPLAEIDLVDLTSGAKEVRGPFAQQTQITGAVTVRHGDRAFTYRTEQPESGQKDEFVAAFKRTVEELRRTERTTTEVAPGRETMNYLASRDRVVSQNPGLLRSLSKSKDRSEELLIDLEGKQRNLRWVEQQIDDLDIEIALHRFDAAVEHIEQHRKLAKSLTSNPVAKDLIMVKVDERASQLADILAQLLATNHAHLARVQLYTSYLARLDFGARARGAYLAARTGVIQQRARACVFEGNVLAHITALSLVYFTLIRNTVGVFGGCFAPAETSACVVWATQRLDTYNAALARSLSGVARGGEAWREGLRRARELAAGMDGVGLDFKEMVGVGLDVDEGAADKR